MTWDKFIPDVCIYLVETSFLVYICGAWQILKSLNYFRHNAELWKLLDRIRITYSTGNATWCILYCCYSLASVTLDSKNWGPSVAKVQRQKIDRCNFIFCYHFRKEFQDANHM
jgi:hypothetical protein